MLSSDDDMELDSEQLSRFLTQSRNKARLAKAHISQPSTASNGGVSASVSSPELQQQLRERAGENAILRDQLSSQAAKHTQELREVLDAQKRSRETQKSELEQLRTELNALRSEKQFLANEVRSKSMTAGRPKISGLATPQTPSQSPAMPVGSARRPASMAFADGFSKKAKIAHHTPSETGKIVPAPAENPLLLHYMPGSEIPSLQMLDNIKNENSGPMTLGYRLLKAPEKTRLKETLEMACLPFREDAENERVSMDSTPIALALAYSELQNGAELTQPEIESLVSFATILLTRFSPLPDLEDIQLEILFFKEDALVLTSLLYVLDILQSINGLRELPENFGDMLVATRVPGIIEKGLGVLYNCEQFREDALIESVLMNENTQPRLEMLFGGLSDAKPIHATMLKSYSTEYLDLGVRKDDLPPWRAVVEEASCGMRAAAVHLLTKSSPTKSIVTRVIEMLSTEVDRVLTSPRRELISACVRYLWLASDKSLFLNNQKNQDEMIVSCARISFSKQYSPKLVGWAQDLLHHCGNPEEIDAIADEML